MSQDNKMTIEQIMVWFVTNIPSLYIISTSIFICWGIFIILSLKKIMDLVKKEELDNFNGAPDFFHSNLILRKCDRIHVGITSSVLIFNVLGMIIVPTVYSYVDLLFVSNVWVFAYYMFITTTSLKQFPKIWNSNHIRELDKKVII
jgi:hypothetical protein